MTKYILVGSEAIRHFNTDKHDLVAKAIKEYKGDLYSIDDLKELDELLENLKGWDDFIEIDETDYDIIQEELDTLARKRIWINVYMDTDGFPFVLPDRFLTEESAIAIGSQRVYYIKSIEITNKK